MNADGPYIPHIFHCFFTGKVSCCLYLIFLLSSLALVFSCKGSFSGQGSCSGKHLIVQCFCTLNFEECSAKENQGEIRKEDRLGPHHTL